MALRLEAGEPGAVYNVINRGNYRSEVLGNVGRGAKNRHMGSATSVGALAQSAGAKEYAYIGLTPFRGGPRSGAGH
jgi:hypothetical protein